MNECRCKDCRWWGGGVVPADEQRGILAPCENEDNGGYPHNHGDDCCHCAGLTYHCNESHILTGPDFGCVHWEGKDE